MPPRPRSFDAVVRAAEQVLRANRVDHVFVGGLAVLAFGRSRTTEDVDVIADLGPPHVTSLCRAFRRRGFTVSEDDLEAALAERTHCTIPDTRSPFRIDLAPVKDEADKHALRDRVTVRVRGLPLPIASPEHTIVMKLKFGGEQDLEDALPLYLRQKDRLRKALLRTFARRQRVL